MNTAKHLSARVAELRGRIEAARSDDDGSLRARDLWDEHLSVGEECRTAGHSGTISHDEWRDLVDSLLICGRLVLGMKLDHHFYATRKA